MDASTSPHPLTTGFLTERFRLRPRELSDTDSCLAMDRDPEVTQYVSGPWTDPDAHRAFIEHRTKGPWPAGMGYWTISPRDEPVAFLGWVLLIPMDGIGPEIEIGWRLPRSAWGRGIATEAARPVLEHALGSLGLREIVAEIDAANIGSLRVAEKLGMVRRGEVLHAGRHSIRYTVTASGATSKLP